MVIAIFLITLWANFASPENLSAEEANKVSIGAIIPLSGDISSWGINVKRGIELAANEVDNISVTYEDESFCNAAKALSGAQRLIADSVRILITGCLNGTRVISPLAERRELLVLSAGLLSGTETESSLRYMLSLSGQIASEGQALAKLISESGFKRLAFVRYDDEFTLAVRDAIESAVPRPQEIIDLPVPAETNDFMPQLLRAKQRGADSLLIYLGESPVLTFMRQRSAIGLTLSVFSGYVVESNAIPLGERRWLDGITYTYPKLAPSSDPLRISFEETYKQTYGAAEQPNSNTYFVYDGIKNLSAALQACPKEGLPCIRSYFLQNSPFSGVSGSFSYTKQGFVQRDFIVKRVINGSFVEAQG
ncbi:MAG: hypothetical protein DCC75_07695 [Proteobacteria bacterium]|nr:MAG: hypothetical protein DCC75_07695 [Pseudomonadota bacterium]